MSVSSEEQWLVIKNKKLIRRSQLNWYACQTLRDKLFYSQTWLSVSSVFEKVDDLLQLSAYIYTKRSV